ncbi:hypothetical protein HDU85_005272 [Gaertneriomyces sp. JEL0708]|nr:hypothetical protein HDU85_005272 [Gaertneriomyces sp. JEL0708]
MKVAPIMGSFTSDIVCVCVGVSCDTCVNGENESDRSWGKTFTKHRTLRHFVGSKFNRLLYSDYIQFLPRNTEPLKQDSERTTIASSPRLPNASVSNANPPPVTGALPTSYPFVSAQGSSTRIPQNLENRTIYVRNTPITLKFCITCQLWRTPRTSHCSTCDRCVENHDHHCPWIANCVGKRNYRYFYTFICACSILSIYIFAFSLIGLLRISRATNRGFGHAITQRPVNFALMLYSVLIGWSVVGMSCYHCWITCEGITTHEQLKQRFNSEQIRRVNSLRRGDDTHGTIGPQSAYPFSRGSGISNMCWILCRHQPPSYMYSFDAPDVEANIDRRPQTQQQPTANGQVFPESTISVET